MKRYKAYKDSGVEWIGEIPEGWKISKIKFEVDMVLGKMLEDKEPKNNDGCYTLEPYLKSRNIGMLELYNNIDQVDKMWFSSKEKAIYELKDGDLVMNEGGDIGKVSIWKNPGFKCYIQNSVHKLTPHFNVTDAAYLQYLISYIATRGYFNKVVSSISISHLTKEKLAETPLILPPLPEQRAIAAYLDHKVGKIDASVAAIDKQIEDLKAYRQSIISETVTKGLNPNAKMKDSGVEWIGDVPEGWKCTRLRYLLSSALQYGASESGDTEHSNYPRYIRITDITDDGKLKEADAKYLEPSIAIPYMLKKGDVLFARSGATVGKTFLFNEDAKACFAGYLIKASCNEKLLPKFLYYYTQTGEYENWKCSMFTQSTIQNIGADKYNELNVPLPPLPEQHAIAAYLDAKTSKIASAITSLEQQRSDLEALKQSIISEAVTGKMDVRN